MKKLALILSLSAACLFFSCSRRTCDLTQSVNPVIGDLSYVSKYGKAPVRAHEKLRISTHLEYVEQLLRQKDVSALSPEMQKKRRQMLDLLHEYLINGVFPRNYDVKDKRVPCFIDKDGRICAVGYLVEQTAGRAISEKINSLYKYEKLMDMDNELINEWIAESGLSKEECAMIQPSYGWNPYYNNNYISTGNAIVSSALGGINLSVNMINVLNLKNPSQRKLVPYLGIASGTASILWGLGWLESLPTMGETRLSMFNIGLGTATIIMSSYTLSTIKRKNKSQTTAWSLYSFPGADKKPGIGLSFSKRL